MLLLSACNIGEIGSESSQPASDDQRVTISFAASDNQRDTYTTLAQRFMAENPDIRVAIVSLDELWDTVPDAALDSAIHQLRHLVSGTDTVLLSGYYIAPDAYNTNLLYNLQPLMEADASFEITDIYPGILVRFESEQGIWALPREFRMPILYYNKALFEQHNLAEPTADWSWDDLVDTAEQLASPSGNEIGTYGLAEQSQGLDSLMAFLQEQEIDLLGTPLAEWQLEQGDIQSLTTQMRTLMESGAISLSPIPPGQYDIDAPRWPQQWIIEGRMGMWSSNQFWREKYHADGSSEPVELNYEIGVVPYPASVQNLFQEDASGYVISGGTQHPNEAWRWITFLSEQPRVQPLLSEADDDIAYLPIPARRSLAEDEALWSRFDSGIREAYATVLQGLNDPSAPSTPRSGVSSALFHTVYEASVQTATNDGVTVEKALADAQSRLQEQLVLIEREPEPDLSPIVVAEPPQEASPDGTLVRFGIPTYQMGQMRATVQTFQQSHPDINVQLTPIDSDRRQIDIQTAAEATDCFSWSAPPQPDDLETLLDLQPLIDADSSFTQDDILGALFTPYQHDGQLYGLPYAFSVDALYYNQSAFDALGLDAPTIDWSPDDFLNTAQLLTDSEATDVVYGYVLESSIYSDLVFFLSRSGVQLTTGSGIDFRPNFTDPAVVEAIQWYLDLALVHGVMPEPALDYRRSETPDDSELTAAPGMWFGGLNTSYEFPQTVPLDEEESVESSEDSVQIPPFEVNIAPLPLNNGALTTDDFAVRGFHISAETPNPQPCWEWLKFLSQDVNNLRNELPARQSLFDDPTLVSQSPGAAAIIELYRDVLMQPSEPGATSGVFATLEMYWFFKALDDAIQGEQDLGEGLAEAQEMSVAYLECLNANEAAARAECAVLVDLEYDGFLVDAEE
ncbi:MAG: extracellular solute-binding protein [Chloroflexi bacterium AL-W]|nr:extracellular solute-binding protein [Chloroflexi bacterium AL-N1]NOK66890.1 extracellular solute-binding protein [Chloroflexi bacterium AL-N10]NOK74818.1 extracellular solute-binding protein [Chloroflexi bacterium AL-N5]NOK81492.1 extracellular solute-binding protein [Chloroflexi bacterium AL-W]NOK88962.1 extracellular solute-binding protein [Chloroflexi bacterium AL-N15]